MECEWVDFVVLCMLGVEYVVDGFMCVLVYGQFCVVVYGQQ